MDNIETPYRKAKQEWDTRMGDSLSRARAWKKVSMILLVICAILSMGIIFYSLQPRKIPYVIEVRENGEAQYKGDIGEHTLTVEEKHVRYYLKKFVENTRTLSSDVVVVKKNWREAYFFLTPTGASILNTYAQEIQPLSRYVTERVDIKFNSILEHSKATRQVNWTEYIWNAQGELISITPWRGIFKLEYKIPTAQEQLEKNPMGIFIDTFNWTEVQ